MRGKKPSVTERQYAEIRRRYELCQSNRPKVIANDLGVSLRTVWHYCKRTPNGFKAE